MTVVDNKRIAKNTIYLYLRMLLVMAVNLYTVRAILDILGVVDYGIYNVVGGVVILFSFMNNTLATSSQRYFSIELAHDNRERLSKWFSLNISAFLLIGLFIVFFLETAGLWFLNTKMVIPTERLMAANVVYQLSIISFLFHIVTIPYSAIIVAHERMNIVAFMGILDAAGKLLTVFVLIYLEYDKLIVYGILVLLFSFCLSMLYILYCRRHFSESRYHWYWNRKEALEIVSFSGWHFLGTFSMGCRNNGINILLNLFFDPVVNAARTIGFQVNSQVLRLYTNFFTAIKPQIYKTYASGELEELYRLIMRGVIISSFLVSLIAFPVIANTSYILGLWLKSVPEYTIEFTQLALISGLIDTTIGPLMATSLATGNIRKYMLSYSTILFLNVPISYIVLKLGGAPTMTMLVSIVMSYLNAIVSVYILHKIMGFPWIRYLFLLSKLSLVSAVIILGIKALFSNVVDNLLALFAVSFIIIVVTAVFYILILNKGDRILLFRFLKINSRVRLTSRYHSSFKSIVNKKQ